MNTLTLIKIVPLSVGLVLSLVVFQRMRLFSGSGMFFRDVNDAETQVRKGIVEIGGLAMLPVFLVSLFVALGMPKMFGYDELSGEVGLSALRIMQVVAGCGILYIVGLKNDMHGTDVRNKFLALLLTASMFPATGLWIENLQGLFGIHQLSLYVGVPLTLFLVMGVTEMVSLLDDIDGLGAGLVTVMGLIFFGVCMWGGFMIGTLVASALLGVVIPYSLIKNTKHDWRKTLIGNAGSYTIGYVLAYLTLSLIQQCGNSMPDGVLMIVLGIILVPMLDVIRMLRQRIRDGRAMLTPDRNQMQHRLIRMGIAPAVAPLLIVINIIIFAALNTVWVFCNYDFTLLAMIDVAIWTTQQTLITYRIRVHENKLNLKAWDITYGREAWEANPPVDIILRKQENFGTMGLPSDVILGKELDFIPDGMNGFERNAKRLFDMLMSGVMLIFTSPLFLLCYVMIKLDDGGPAIYTQERLGRFGRPFMIYKFRSMRLDAEKDGPALSHAGGDDDPRLTRTGRFLRTHHLDELPQLWNVFCGEMTFIGYRPERKFFIDQIMEHDPRYAFLYQIRPGVTSYATLYNGYTDTMEKMLRRLSYDLYYLEHRSFWFDLRILWLTFISIVFGKKF